MEKQKTDETNIPRINSETSHMSADHSTASQSTAGSTLGDNQSNKGDDLDLEKQLEFNEGILYNPRLIYDNIATNSKYYQDVIKFYKLNWLVIKKSMKI